MTRLHYHGLWLFTGWCMVGLVVYMSLATSGVPVVGSFLNDKVAHVTGYFGLMFWFVQLYTALRSRFIIGLLLVSMGVGLEFAQEMGGVRTYEVADMLANATGVLIGLAAASSRLDQVLYWFERKVLAV